MKGLLLVLTLVALSAGMAAAKAFHKVDEGVYTLGDEGESEVHVEEGEWRRYTVQSNGDGGSVSVWPEVPRSAYNNSHLIEGSVGLWDVMLAQYQPHRSAVPGFVVVQDIPYAGVDHVFISFIRVVQTSGQSAIPTIVAGGLGRSNVTIRLTSLPGQGFQFSIDIWGR